MNTQTAEVVGSSAELGRLPAPDVLHSELGTPFGYSPEVVLALLSAERERWQQVAKAVIESHDAALAYVYERLRSQGVGSITIPDSVAAEIRAVNALRELVQPNDGSNRHE